MAAALSSHLSPKGRIQADELSWGPKRAVSPAAPNLQQVPRLKAFREAAIAPDGWSFVVADTPSWSFAFWLTQTQDREMCGAFQRGEDLRASRRGHYTKGQSFPGTAADCQIRELRPRLWRWCSGLAAIRRLVRHPHDAGGGCRVREHGWGSKRRGGWHRPCAEDARDSARRKIRIPGPGLERHPIPPRIG